MSKYEKRYSEFYDCLAGCPSPEGLYKGYSGANGVAMWIADKTGAFPGDGTWEGYIAQDVLVEFLECIGDYED